MAFYRLTLFHFLKSQLVLVVLLQLAACNSGSGEVSSELVKLNWIAPSEREDGTPLSLSEIAGYRIYYGSSTGAYPNLIEMMDGSAVEVNLNNLSPGLYYFVITTLDTDGRESAFSEEVMINI